MYGAEFPVGRDIRAGCQKSAGESQEPEHEHPRAAQRFSREVYRKENQPLCADRRLRHRVHECRQ